MRSQIQNCNSHWLLFVALFAALLPGCSLVRKPWPSKSYDEVRGYQFTNPSGPLVWPSPVLGATLNSAALEKLKRRESALNADQTRILLDATFSDRFEGVPAGCYFPHHVFVFYSKQKPVGAIEVCFMCAGKRCWPDQPKDSKTNYPQLEKLAKELGIGTEAPKGEKIVLPEDPFAPPGNAKLSEYPFATGASKP
jgi:hypothetical protein|uniref:hypothetical protein n=1 Tax=Prosthecobacter sp. TaxID=1965333 RepID=UPI0037841753